MLSRYLTHNANSVSFVAGSAAGSVITTLLARTPWGNATDYHPVTMLVVVALALYLFVRTETKFQATKHIIMAMNTEFSPEQVQDAITKHFKRGKEE